MYNQMLISATLPSGVNAPNWGWNGGSGLATIFAGFGIAPSIAAGFGIIIFCIAKFGVLKRKDSAKWALYSGPAWFFVAITVSATSL